MKYLVLLVIAVAVFLIWRNNRAQARSIKTPRGSANSASGQPQDMIACALCDVHVPRTDALPGPGGKLYCSADHRQRAQT
jgi:uncharacterized protein